MVLMLLHLTYAAPSADPAISSNNCTSALAAIEKLGLPAKGEFIDKRK